MKYITGVYWEAGCAAALNQDSVVLLQALTARGRVLMAAVCDGMGGHARGEMASGYVTRRLQEWFYGPLLRSLRKKKPYWVIRRSLERLVYHMQEQLSQYGRREQIWLGTTMTVLVIWEKTYLLWHLGDSRAYHWREREGYGIRKGRSVCGEKRQKPVCMTQDHVQGENRLTKCVGSFGFMRPDFRMGMMRSGQAVLLCSDGFWHKIMEDELADVLRPGQIRDEEQIVHRLREIGGICMKRGERDNMSAIYVKTDR